MAKRGIICEILYHSFNSLFHLSTSLKDLFDLCSSFDQPGQKRDLSLHKEPHPRKEVCKKISASEFIIDQHGCLMNPPPPPDAFNKGLVEKVNVSLFGSHSLLHSHLSQCIHQKANIDLIGTSSSAGLTGDAEPDGAASEDLCLSFHLDHPDETVRPDIHIRGSGTACGALEALITEV